ncbi:MAG: serine hydrolase domain-containing protein [Solirubrobacterales bacterium]
MRSLPAALLAALATLCLAAAPAGAASDAAGADRQLDRALHQLVAAEGGPPGAIAVVQRGSARRVHAAGVADLGNRAPLRAGKRMRIASVSKAFSGATALSLVAQGVLRLDDTIAELLPELPAAWHRVTLGQALHHTSGLPDFSQSEAFAVAAETSSAFPPPPRALLSYVADQPLRFTPDTAYEYSNSDNVVVALMVQAATGTPYVRALRKKVTGPLGLGATRMANGILLPDPFLHGYSPTATGGTEDVSQIVAFGGWAWASGGILSTPGNLNRFVRGYVGRRIFGAGLQRRQFDWVPGASEPPGPGANSAGLAVFRYRTRCGTVYGHTGSILGYTQLIAASRDGRRSLAFSITTQAPKKLVPRLRRAQTAAVCAALAG